MFFDKMKLDNKLKQLKSIYESTFSEDSYENGKKAFSLAKEIVAESPSCNEAKIILAACYNFGIGCNEDISSAKKLYLEVSKDPNCSYALKQLGNIAFRENDAKAFDYYSEYLMSNLEDNDVLLGLADCYFKGLGTPQDKQRAMEIYKEISETKYGTNEDFQIRYGEFLDEIENPNSIIWFHKAMKNETAYETFYAAYRIAGIIRKAHYLPYEAFPPTERVNTALNYYKYAMTKAADENEFNLAQDSYNILEAELEHGVLVFYYKTDDGKEVAYKCHMNE